MTPPGTPQRPERALTGAVASLRPEPPAPGSEASAPHRGPEQRDQGEGRERAARLSGESPALGGDPARPAGSPPVASPVTTHTPDERLGAPPSLALPGDDLLGPPPSLVQDGGDVVSQPLPSFSHLVPAETARRVGEQLLGALTAGDRQVELQLDPPHLGRLRLHLEINGTEVSAHLVTQTAAARDLLDDRSRDLERQLADQGLKLTGFQVTLDTEGQARSFEREAATARFTPERPAPRDGRAADRDAPGPGAPNRVDLGLNRIDMVA